MMAPRTVVVAIDVPAGVDDLAFAKRVQTILRQACIASPDQRDLLWPDPASIEVTVLRLPATSLFIVDGEPA